MLLKIPRCKPKRQSLESSLNTLIGVDVVADKSVNGGGLSVALVSGLVSAVNLVFVSRSVALDSVSIALVGTGETLMGSTGAAFTLIGATLAGLVTGDSFVVIGATGTGITFVALVSLSVGLACSLGVVTGADAGLATSVLAVSVCFASGVTLGSTNSTGAGITSGAGGT